MRTDKYAQENTQRMEKRLLTSARSGLSCAEVKERQRAFGKNNILPKDKGLFTSFLLQAVRNGSLPLFGLAFAVLLSRSFASALLVAVLYVMYLGVLFLLFSYRSREKAALESALLPKVRVIREGEMMYLSPEELVVGDLLSLQAGDILYSYAHLLSEEPIKVFCRRGEKSCIAEKYGGACFNVTEESHNFLAPGDVVREGVATAFVTEMADEPEEDAFQSETVKAQSAVCRMAGRVSAILVLLLLLAAFLYNAKAKDGTLLYHALAVSAVLLAFAPTDYIELFCDVIFLKENRHLLRTKQAYLADLTVAERLSEVDSYVLSTRSLYRSSRFIVRYFEAGNGKRFAPSARASCAELSLVCSAVQAIHEKDSSGVVEKNLLSYCRAHSGTERLKLHSVMSYGKFSLASFTNPQNGKTFSVLAGDAERIVEEATFVSEEGRARLLDARTKNAMLAVIRKKKADGYHLLAYAETQKKVSEGDLSGGFPDMRLLGIFVLSELPDAKISGTLRELMAEGKKAFFLHDGDDPSWLKEEIALLKQAPVLDGGSPSFADEIQIFATDPDISFCIGVHLSPLQQAQVVHALEKAGHRVAAAGRELSDHRLLCAASVGIVPIPDGKRDISPLVRASGALCAKEHLTSQVGCVQKAARLPGAFGVITSYLCASLICRVMVAAFGFFFGVSLLSGFWYACFGMVVDLTAAWLLSHSRPQETHHIGDTLRKAKERSVSFFIGSLCGAFVTGGLSLVMVLFPARFDMGASAFLFVSLLLMLNVGLWSFVRERGQTTMIWFSLLSAFLIAAFFLLPLVGDGRYGAAFTPAVFFWALLPTTVMVVVGRAVIYANKQKYSQDKGATS